MANIFSRSLPVTRVKHSVFDLSRDYKTSFNFGQLVPVYFEEVLPGDKFRIGSDVMIRLSPLVAPIMDRLDVRLDFFFVPHRLCFNACGLSFEDFITGGSDGKVEVPMPFFNANSEYVDEFANANTLPDYFGIQPHASLDDDDTYSALPFIAYHMICDNFYRDQTFQDEIAKNIPVKASGEIDLHSSFTPLLYLRRRCYGKDYFTTAMPSPQRGDSVYLISPFAGSFTPEGSITFPAGSFSHIHELNQALADGGNLVGSLSPNETIHVDPNNPTRLEGDVSHLAPNLSLAGHTDDEVWVGQPEAEFVGEEGSIGGLDPVTVNEFFTLQSIQRWLNHNNNYGGRYIEQLAGHFGVVSSDARLQLPEYLGGGKAPIQISEVLQTAQNTSENSTSGIGVGDFAGHGIGFGRTSNIRRYFNEHGMIIGMLSVIPKNSYGTGCPKFFLKKDRFDFAFPEFSNIGEQPILNKEIFISGDKDVDKLTFGYTPRYAEYRVGNSIVTGDFRSSLNYWHLARTFDSTPALGEDFLQVAGSELNRIFQVPDEDVQHIWCDVYHNVRAVRPLPLLPNTSLL